jgi:anthranilate phosphoribosyltransferase
MNEKKLIDYQNSLVSGYELNEVDVEDLVKALLNSDISDQIKKDFLVGFHQRGETASELAFFVKSFLKQARGVSSRLKELDVPTIDVAGTGGDQLNLVNLSTMMMFVLAAAGVVVVKHGNRGVTSKSGGADMLEALGVKLDLDTELLADCVEETGMGFCFAPYYHPTFKAVVGARKLAAAEGQHTMFNLLGPLLNPLQTDCQLVGIYERQQMLLYAGVLAQLGRKRAMVVHGCLPNGAGMDELSVFGHNDILSVVEGSVGELEQWTREPAFSIDQIKCLKGEDGTYNAKVAVDFFKEPQNNEVLLEMISLNAGAGLQVAGVVNTINDGIDIARELICGGLVYEKLRVYQQWFTSLK